MALSQILTTDSVSASIVNTKIVDTANTDISGLQIAQAAGGTATAITLTGVELTNGYQKTFIISASNSGSATTINGKPLYKPGGTVAPNLVAGKAASIWYNLAGDCFFYKASAEGTAVAGDVLAGVTFSNDDDIGLIGTLTLTGDATTNDVVFGKTFYGGDAKTKLTGDGLNAKKCAFGENTTSSTLLTFLTDAGSASYYYLNVSGLTFLPSAIIIIMKEGSLYKTSVLNKNKILGAINQDARIALGSSGAILRLTGNAYVSETGFLIPVFTQSSPSLQAQWLAFE